MRLMFLATLGLLAITGHLQAQTPAPPTAIPGVLWMYPDGTHLFIPTTPQPMRKAQSVDYLYQPQYQATYQPQYAYSQAWQQQGYYMQDNGGCSNGSCGQQRGILRGRGRR